MARVRQTDTRHLGTGIYPPATSVGDRGPPAQGRRRLPWYRPVGIFPEGNRRSHRCALRRHRTPRLLARMSEPAGYWHGHGGGEARRAARVSGAGALLRDLHRSAEGVRRDG
ncbi:hypothetical protein ACHAWF_001240 [Thalassiosira exigua]